MRSEDLGLESADCAAAIVGIASIMPDAPDNEAFWRNVLSGKDSIREVPLDRWEPKDYYDPDPAAVDKTYCKIGAFVHGFAFDSARFRIPPRVAAAMDVAQQWALVLARAALQDAGHPDSGMDPERIGVILGNALGGELHERTSMRVMTPEVVHALEEVPEFALLPEATRRALAAGMLAKIRTRLPPITEDSMPGELGNVIAGRITNSLDLRGMNFTADAACASSLAALDAALAALAEKRVDAVVTGGVDRTMAPSTFVKFAKIGALSKDGSRPFDAGANGFVMGEGGALFVLRRLADAEKAGQKIYAVIRSVGAASDGKGKGITAPNPSGQLLALKRAYQIAGFSPATLGLIEAHGTSTRVGDVAEVETLANAFGNLNLPQRSIGLGSVKSQIGHLKSGAGAAGLLKAALALHHKVLPPTINVREPNAAIPFDKLPFFLVDRAQPWERPAGGLRRAAVSSFGFGGTNFHVVLEEHVPGLLSRKVQVQSGSLESGAVAAPRAQSSYASAPASAASTGRFNLVAGGAHAAELKQRLAAAIELAKSGAAPQVRAQDLAAPERVAFDYGNPAELEQRGKDALAALEKDLPPVWKALRARGIFRGSGPAQKTAFLFPGQGSQYLGMLKELRQRLPEVRATFDEADAAMANELPRRLNDYIYAAGEPEKADLELRETRVCQPAMLAADIAVLRALQARGFGPDFAMGHSLGEYAALVAAEALPLSDAIHAVSGRAREMANVSIADNGKMASIFAPGEIVQKVLAGIQGYVVAANVNSRNQTVIGGATGAVQAAVAQFEKLGIRAVPIPVSHAFHTEIVAAASSPLRRLLDSMPFSSPKVPLISNVTGEPYPTGPGALEKMKDLLGRQIASPVQFVKGIESLYAQGARIFVEVGPRKVLASFVEDVLGNKAVTLFTNQPRKGEVESFHEALSGLYAAGLGRPTEAAVAVELRAPTPAAVPAPPAVQAAAPAPAQAGAPAPALALSQTVAAAGAATAGGDFAALGMAIANLIQVGVQAYRGATAQPAPLAAAPAVPPPAVSSAAVSSAAVSSPSPSPSPSTSTSTSTSTPTSTSTHPSPVPAAPLKGSVVISGASVGLPGRNRRVFAEDNFEAMLRGETLIDSIDREAWGRMVDKNVVRLHKGSDGAAHFVAIDDPKDVLKLAGQRGQFDLVEEFGVEKERAEAFDITTKLGVAAAILALRDAGIPLVRRYRATSRGTWLPDRWVLPESFADETGVVFASAFPGMNSFIGEARRYYEDKGRRDELALLETLKQELQNGAGQAVEEKIAALKSEMEREPRYQFNRKFLFNILSMGHSQLAEILGARGPNTQVNAACASAAQAVGVAEDWIRTGRCRRVVVVSADDVTSREMIEWTGTGFLASGAASTEADVAKAALPFDRRRHGLIMGMGANGLVLEAEEAVRERGMRGIAEVVAIETANSAFHGSRLDVEHISQVMERLVSRVEAERSLNREEIASQGVFVSHETYTPARGGSASAEIQSLRRAFGPAASRLTIANTKGFTGHAMGAGVEESVAIKILETGRVPPVANLKEPDPELGDLRLSQGGHFPARFALRLAAGFGSQIVISLFQKIRGPKLADAAAYQRWLEAQSGRPGAKTFVENNALKVADDGPPPMPAAKSTWQFGEAPKLRAEVESGTVSAQVAAAVGAPSRPSEAKKAPAAKAASLAAAGADPVAEKVLELVSQKTGYPRDMLAMDLDLEADLGIDTVKQAEVFAELRTTFELPRREDLKLREYPTLKRIIELVRELKPDLGPAPAAAAAPEPSAPAAASVAAVDPVAEKVLELVSQKTGYPRDMLALDLDLEADLGIDTVKQAEVFAELRTTFELPRREDLKLREYPTLKRIIELVRELKPDLGPAPAAAAPALAPAPAPIAIAPAAVASAAVDPVAEKVLELVAQKTGYPREMLALDLDLEADLGIDTVKQAEVFAELRTTFELPRREDLKLREYPTLKRIIELVRELKPDLGPAPLAAAAAPAPAATVSAAAPAPAMAAPATGIDPVEEKVLELVAQKTGYPREMLALDLDLEADLGIDTVKQAEVFAELRTTFELPRREDLKLREYPTLKHIIGLVRELKPELGAAPQVAVAASPAPAPAPAPAAAAPAGADPVTERVLDLVAAKTGYPREMLAMDLDLEADLGIDTVKQAEVFAELRTSFSLPRRESLKLREYPTLARIIELVRELQREGSAAPASEAKSEAAATAPVKVVRRIPAPALRPELDLCKETGVRLESGARVAVIPDAKGVAGELKKRLKKRGVQALILSDGPVDAQLTALLAEGPIAGLFHLAALDAEPDLVSAEPSVAREVFDARVRRLYAAARALLPGLGHRESFLVAGTRLNGLHGFGEEPATAPAGGAVTGFVKAFARENPEALVKAVDFAASAKAGAVAEALIAEALRDPGAVEVGHAFGARHAIAFTTAEAGAPVAGLELTPETVFAVTGAAGGITSAILRDLAAAAKGGAFWLAGTAPLPDAASPDLAKLRDDRAALQREIFERLKAQGERATPAAVEKVLAGLERDLARLDAVRSLEALGAKVQYRALDVRDPAAVTAFVEEIKAAHGRIDVLVHGAGLEKSRMLADKGAEEFDAIFDIKALGLLNLLRAAREMPLGAVVSFTSVAGRFGNAGQTDYSAANDFVAKLTLALPRTFPKTRALALDWTAWAGAGMATRGSVPEMMRRAGIDMLPLEAGVPVVREELASGRAGEVVVAGNLGMLLAPKDPEGGLDLSLVARWHSERPQPMVGKVLKLDLYEGLVVETALDPAVEPFLRDHAIDGVPVLPGVMGLEGFAEAARLLAPGHRVSGFTDVRFEAPMKFHRQEARPATLRALVRRAGEKAIAADVTLSSMRPSPAGEVEVRHFSGTVRLSDEPASPRQTEPGSQLNGGNPREVKTADIYRIYFHGPSYQVLDQVEVTGEGARSQFRKDLPPALREKDSTLVSPRLIELCLQTAGVYEIGKTGRMALPSSIDRLVSYAPPSEDQALTAEVRPTGENGSLSFAARVVDAEGRVYLELDGYRTSALPTAIPGELVAPLRDAFTGNGT